MSHASVPPQYSWVCPRCNRRVPNRLSECRCGSVRTETGAETIGPFAPETPHAPTAGQSVLPWMVLGVATLVAAGSLIALQVIPARRPQEPSGAPDLSRAPVASGRAPTVASPSADTPATHDVPFTPGTPITPAAPALAPRDGAWARQASDSLEDVVSRSIPAIVSIEAGDSRGSGFFAAARTVITNRHVVQDNVSVTIRLSTGQTLPGRVESSSTESDLAIVRVDSALPSQSVLPLGSVADVRPGQEVIAIGLALGVFQNSVTRGIISAVRRADRTVMLQTDAAINPGNSGGPLLNRQGDVVGVNTLKISGTAESLGFAVAVDHARGMLAGGRPSEMPPGTSAISSKPLAPAFAAGSSVDAVREQGTRRYDQVVVVIARHAAQLDGYWARIKANCPVRVAERYDREWFGLWDGRTALTNPDIPCSSAVRDLEQLASEIRVAMTAAQEDARRAAVLPGQLRDIRRRYRMDWRGWE